MTIDAAIDLSILQAVELATGNCIADPVMIVQGEGFDLGSYSPEFATGACIADPNVIVNGECLEIGMPGMEFGPDVTIPSDQRTMTGNGAIIKFRTRAPIPGDNTQIIGEGYRMLQVKGVVRNLGDSSHVLAETQAESNFPVGADIPMFPEWLGAKNLNTLSVVKSDATGKLIPVIPADPIDDATDAASAITQLNKLLAVCRNLRVIDVSER